MTRPQGVMSKRLIGLALMVCGLGLSWPAAVMAEPPNLAAVIDNVAKSWPDVRHVPPADIAALAADPATIVFDVREEAEFQVSHLPGAIRVPPGTWRSTFMSAHGDALRNKTVVFYCSVGVRSSKLASAVQAAVREHGAADVVNMAGGIFAWHGESRPLVNAAGATDAVHGYDKSWGRLIERQDKVLTDPQ